MKTYVALVLDRSLSMKPIKTQTIMLYNEQVQQLKLDSEDDKDIHCSLVTFNGNVFEHLWNVPASELCESTDEGYNPEGGTALYDAVCHTVKKLQKEDQKDARFLVMVITDGDDTMFGRSKYNQEAMTQTIAQAEKAGNWTITFMGCDKSSLLKLAKTTGMRMGNVAVWDPSMADKAFEGHTRALKHYLQEADHEVKTAGGGFYGQECLDFTAPPTQWNKLDVLHQAFLQGSADVQSWNSAADLQPRGIDTKKKYGARAKPSMLRSCGLNSNHLDDSPENVNVSLSGHTWTEGLTNVFGTSCKVDLS